MTDRYAADFRIEGEGLTAGDVDEVKIQLWEVADAFNGSVIVQRRPWPGPLVAAPPSVPADVDLRDRIRLACAEADGFRFEGLEPHDYQKHADAILALFPPSAYRRLLARLEADRAGHLRAAGEATEEVLRIDGAVSASTLRHAAAMAVHAFEGPDAAQAYMQRTEDGEETAGAPDGRSELASLAVNAGRALADEKRHYEIACKENAELRARILDYENRITWDTTCGSCARILDSGNRERERAERSEAALDQVRAVISEIDTEMRTEPDTQRSAMQMETVTRIGAALAYRRRMADEARQADTAGES